FAAGDDRPGAEPVAVLSHAVWEQSFGSDPAVVGSLQELDGVRRRVVGVMPPGFSFPEGASVWVPLEIDPVEPDPGAFSWLGIGRLRPGETPASAQADMAELLRRFAEANPDELSPEVLEQAGLVPDARPLKELYVQDMARALWVLLGTVGFVLLIAVANVANLFLVRAEARMREQAVRTALGASRRDMVRLYLAESVALATGGGILGLGLATAGVRGLLAIAPVAVPRSTEIGIDGSVLAFTAVVSVLSGLLFGLFPVLGYARDDLSSALREGGRSATAGRKRHRARGALVVSQIALALVLLVGSGLMARSFLALRSVDPGFDAQGRLAFRVSLPSAEYPDAEAGALLHARLLERMAAVPGVESVALASALPLEETKNASPMESEDRPIPENELGPVIDRRLVSPGYFGTMGIGLEGRELTREDRADGTRAVVVSRALARLLWPGESALGRRLRPQGVEDGWWEVVGVADDVHFESLGAEPAPLLYVPMVSGHTAEPTPSRSFQVVLKVAGNPVSFTAAAAEALGEVDPRLPMVEPRAVEGIVRDAMAATSFTVVLLGIAAAIALVLGTVGIYGVISYVVSRRTAEIGVRMALGAPAARVLREVVGQGATLASAGIAVGLLGAWGVSRVLSSLLYGVTATDPLTFAGTAALLVLVALLASWIPARRASRIDPVEALRAE
ncbi:MAG TPA: ABC transporter permease, partial [Longimicrobiales bacterium]|nr:ABC transporter permease [Longimicrobiales bacterium]